MLVRLVILLVVFAVAFGLVRILATRRGSALVVPAGLTLVVGPGCTMCVEARRGLDALGAVYDVVDVEEARAFGVPSLTVPYAIVGSADGDLLMVRRGRLVVTDMARLIEAARTGQVTSVTGPAIRAQPHRRSSRNADP